MSKYEDKQILFENTLYDMLSLLPSSYNKEVQDTNYFKLLRSLAEQLAEAKINITEVSKGSSIETVSSESLYNNFGVLVKLERRAEWSDDKYRKLISGVMKSLIVGPTKESIIEAFKTFFDFNVKVYELFKEQPFIPGLPPIITANRFMFMLELEIPIDIIGQTNTIDLDSIYLIDIIKPAHTLSFFVKTYVGEENYKRNYSIDKKIYQIADNCINLKIKNEINKKINELFKNEHEESGMNIDNFSHSVRGIDNVTYLNNIQEKARQKYLQYLQSITMGDIYLYPIPKKITNEANDKLYTFLNLVSFFNSEFPTFNEVVEQLSRDYVGALGSITDEVRSLFKEKLQSFIIEATYDEMTPYEENLLQQLREEAFDIEYQDYTLDDVNALVSDIVAKLGITPGEALLRIKNDALHANILSELGGRYAVYTDCLKKAEEYRVELERKFNTVGAYYGMDEVQWEINSSNTEGVYGWRSFGYPLQLMTSTNRNISQIGGPSLIGPNYTMHDSNILAVMTFSDGTKETKTEEYFK